MLILGATGSASYMVYYKIHRPFKTAIKESEPAAQDVDPVTTNVPRSEPENDRVDSTENVSFAPYSFISPRHIAQHL
jgi:hypothetical protein